MEHEKNSTESASNENYDEYTGIWTENGISHDLIISAGGTEFSVNITNKNELRPFQIQFYRYLGA
ncbi:hypothetical protein acsn021_35190 [Anaerocolumna cellulosilytica]|uniref:Uncharacterized protein n=1 Tax=Anaerocolumna cellulosilytica TaxID=433286 RepID=A0A6S6R958_9FIRM|nr:hypothetical protein [Anaerocolumna cellulosilytica]MBB5195418.1 hypothetical protein [Anaerocolumna cellulosilytica]BCJ95950.1 hypothetical protein acsn021_35190 [Anaerocolumna cellulosilytica]